MPISSLSMPLSLLLEHKIRVFVRFCLRDPRFRAFRAQNRGFCALLVSETTIFGRFEHKIGVFVLGKRDKWHREGERGRSCKTKSSEGQATSTPEGQKKRCPGKAYAAPGAWCVTLTITVSRLRSVGRSWSSRQASCLRHRGRRLCSRRCRLRGMWLGSSSGQLQQGL